MSGLRCGIRQDRCARRRISNFDVTNRSRARPTPMRKLLAFLLLSLAATAQQLPSEDAVRINEFYRLATQIRERVWPRWSPTPAPLLLVTGDTEFLTHHASPPPDFQKVSDDLYARPRQFPPNLLATFPPFGPPAVIVIG